MANEKKEESAPIQSAPLESVFLYLLVRLMIFNFTSSNGLTSFGHVFNSFNREREREKKQATNLIFYTQAQRIYHKFGVQLWPFRSNTFIYQNLLLTSNSFEGVIVMKKKRREKNRLMKKCHILMKNQITVNFGHIELLKSSTKMLVCGFFSSVGVSKEFVLFLPFRLMNTSKLRRLWN